MVLNECPECGASDFETRHPFARETMDVIERVCNECGESWMLETKRRDEPDEPPSVPSFVLVLHDFGNLQMQAIHTSEDRQDLERMADNMNFILSRAGRAKQFEADVYEN